MVRDIEYAEAELGGKRQLVFTVAIANGASVYMSVQPQAFSFDDHAVVLVKADRFLAMWRAEPTGIHARDANGSPISWREHYKFHRAAKGFSYGLPNPVPLAQVFCEFEGVGTLGDPPAVYVSFTNGITRTIWLLAKECPMFPVLCPLPGAIALHEHAGVAGIKLLSLSPKAAGSDAA